MERFLFEKLNKDQHLFDEWHKADWKTKFSMLSKFRDDRNIIFGQQILFNEAPEVLPSEIYKKIKKKVASRILSSNKEKWFTRFWKLWNLCQTINRNIINDTKY